MSNKMLNNQHWQRLEAAFTGGEPDRTPTIGGWISSPQTICDLTGVSLEEYWADPRPVSIRAYERLGCDGLIENLVPTGRDGRIVDEHTYASADRGKSFEQCCDEIDAMQSPEDVLAGFDFDTAYEGFKAGLLAGQEAAGEMVWFPARWNACACLGHYHSLGYENFFLMVGLHPERIAKMVRVSAAEAHCTNRLVACAVEEGIHPHALFMGEDITTQRGLMVSPDFMREHWYGPFATSIEPLLDAGCKPIFHCDGDVRELVPFLLEAGIQGLQGFQGECGITLDYVTSLRTREGNPLVLFGPITVTIELPFMTPDEIRQRVHDAIDACRGKASLCLFTANTINPDCPPENIIAMYEAVRD
ncbi:MAG: hypothetical protein ACYS8X_04555 [Planctomycetota bacterium]|jgi:hypothetical protein